MIEYGTLNCSIVNRASVTGAIMPQNGMSGTMAVTGLLKVTSESIKQALGYVPANAETVAHLQEEIRDVKTDIGDAEILLSEI